MSNSRSDKQAINYPYFNLNFKTHGLDTDQDKNQTTNLIHDLKSLIKDISSRSIQIDNFCKAIQNEIQGTSFTIPSYLKKSYLDDFIISAKLNKLDITGFSIGAVDGGLTTGTLTGIDVIGLKSTSVYFNYGKNVINRVSYYPKKHQEIQIHPSFHNFSLNELKLYSSLLRSILEIKTAINGIEHAPSQFDYYLMDGSFQLSRTLSSSSEINHLTGKYFAYIKKLVKLCERKDIELAFIVKDTRETIFTEILGRLLPHILKKIPSLYSLDYRNLIKSIRDSNLFFKLLLPGTRSFIINRAYNKQQENLEFSFNSYSTFLKVIENDNPIRIDFISQSSSKSQVQKKADNLAELILSLSSFSSIYSLPAPIIEADARSKINLNEFNRILDTLKRKTGYSADTYSLKRNNSPFKFKG